MKVSVTLLLLTTLLSQSGRYSGPAPDDVFWHQLIAKSGEAPLRSLYPDGPALRLVRVPGALVFATVVTLEPAAHGARARVRQMPDRRESGSRLRTISVSSEQWEEVRRLAREGLWSQRAVAATGASPNMVDGVLWYIEGVRGGDYWAIVRHEPRDPAVVELCSFIMTRAQLPEESPEHPR